MSDETVTVTIPVKQATQAHIEHLQATLAKRNEQIERLTERLEQAEAGEPNQAKLGEAYNRGWQAASTHLMDSTADLACALAKVRKDAMDIYLTRDRDF